MERGKHERRKQMFEDSNEDLSEEMPKIKTEIGQVGSGGGRILAQVKANLLCKEHDGEILKLYCDSHFATVHDMPDDIKVESFCDILVGIMEQYLRMADLAGISRDDALSDLVKKSGGQHGVKFSTNRDAVIKQDPEIELP